MLRGCDISHWNGEHFIEDLFMKDNVNKQFIIIKATQGKSFIDPNFQYNVQCIENYKPLYGFYHYAMPEINTAKDEADFFCEVVEKHIGKAIFALDWEGEALKYDEVWPLKWLNRVYANTGVRPLLYTSKAYIKNFPKVAESNFGLWLARWAGETGNISPWKFWTVWQYTSQPFDLDYFNGDESQWMKYCYSYKENDKPVEIQEPMEIEFKIKSGDKIWHGKTTLSLITDSEES